MKIPSHVDKISRLSELRGRLHPLDDFELWYWTTLTAGTNILNATLHAAGVTRDERVFSTIPGVHVVPQPDGSYARELRGLGDVSHVGWPPIEGAVPAHIRRLEGLLHQIEEYREPCIRGERPPTQAVVNACDSAFESALSIYQSALPRDTP